MAALNKSGGFDDRFLSKLSKVDQQGIESFLGNLVREKQLLQVVFNAMLDGLVVLRPNLEVLYINNAAVELLGISRRSRLYREHFTTLVDVQGIRDLMARFALNHAPIMHAEVEIPEPNARWLDVSILPLGEDFNQQAGSAVIIIHDNTDLRQANQAREKTERTETLARLTAALAHEIKNPLNSLQIHAQLLNRAIHEPDQDRVDHDRMRQSSDIILEEISRLSTVVNEFLTAVRPTRPMKSLSDINRLIEHVHATLQPELDTLNITCTLRLDREIPNVRIDPAQVTQAVLNLVKNSMEALQELREQLNETDDTPPELEDWQPAMEIKTRLQDNQYVIQVADNGPGISKDAMEKAFEPYYTTKFSGTGLGLAIVSRIVEEHGGTMDVSSRPLAGTAIAIRLPLDGRPVRLLDNLSESAAPTESAPP